MIRREVIEKHLLDLADMVAELERHRSKSADELRTDRTALLAVEHALQRAIQNLLDISLHVLSGEGINDWDDYRGAILKLGEAGVVPAGFAEQICGMAGMRNILVHGYIDLEIERLVDVLENRLDDFRRFSRHAVEFMEEKQGTGD